MTADSAAANLYVFLISYLLLLSGSGSHIRSNISSTVFAAGYAVGYSTGSNVRKTHKKSSDYDCSNKMDASEDQILKDGIENDGKDDRFQDAGQRSLPHFVSEFRM
jgi:hypothetical protein